MRKITNWQFPQISQSEYIPLFGPGFAGFGGGIMNPSIIVHHDQYYMLAKGQLMHWHIAEHTNRSLFTKGNPILFSLDKNFAITSFEHLVDHIILDKANVATEDFRLFSFEEKLFAHHSVLILSPNLNTSPILNVVQQISAVDFDTRSLRPIGAPKLDFPLNPFEKNWVYFSQDNKLYLFYSFFPYRVTELVDWAELKFKTIIHEPGPENISDLGGFNSYTSFSTDPVSYDDHHLLLFIHKAQSITIFGLTHRIYHHWAVLLSRKTLKPVKIAKRPSFKGGRSRGILGGVVFLMSVLPLKEEFVVSLGEGDSFASIVRLSRFRLEKDWIDFNQISISDSRGVLSKIRNILLFGKLQFLSKWRSR